MESVAGVRVKTVISEEHGRTRSNSPSPGNFDTLYKSVNLLSSLWSDYFGKGIDARGFQDSVENANNPISRKIR